MVIYVIIVHPLNLPSLFNIVLQDSNGVALKLIDKGEGSTLDELSPVLSFDRDSEKWTEFPRAQSWSRSRTLCFDPHEENMLSVLQSHVLWLLVLLPYHILL